MVTIRFFEEIKSWQAARKVYQKLADLIDQGRFRKNYRLIHQVERSSGSIMDNIAEGFERGAKGEFILFMGYAKGSFGELRSQLYRAHYRKYITDEVFQNLKNAVLTISSLIQNLIKYLQSSSISGVRNKDGSQEH